MTFFRKTITSFLYFLWLMIGLNYFNGVVIPVLFNSNFSFRFLGN